MWAGSFYSLAPGYSSCMMNITGVVGVQCVLFYITNNFSMKVRLFIPVSVSIKIFIAHLAGNCWSTPTTQNNKSHT